MDLLRQSLGSGADEALDTAVAHALLRKAAAGGSGPVVRVYRPRTRIVAFGRRGTLLPGFPRAVQTARAEQFTPVVRAPGGRAVAFTEQALIVDHVSPEADPMVAINGRFPTYADLWASALRMLGVDARVGAVPGEYCPGPYSVNGHGRVKLVGTAQRMIRNAWLFSAVAIVDDTQVLQPLLAKIYDDLGMPFRADSVGSVADEAPGISLHRLEQAVLAAYRERGDLAPAQLDDQLLLTAGTLLNNHRVTTPPPG